MERAGLTHAVRQTKASSGGVIIQPKREAEIIRRLAARHSGPLPFGAVARIWREIISASAAQQKQMSVAVYAPPAMPGPWDLARDHFGSQIPMTPLQSPSQVIRAVTERDSVLGVLPVPLEDDAEPWWPQLLSLDADAPRVIQRLPSIRAASPGQTLGGQASGNARAALRDVLVIARQPVDPATLDYAYLAMEIAPNISRTRLFAGFAAVGLVCGGLSIWTRGDLAIALVELAGPVATDDARLTELTAQLAEPIYRIYHIGGHPAPLTLS